MSWEAAEATRRTEPSASGLRALASVLGAGAVVDVQRLHGGVATAVHRVSFATGDGLQDVVVKRFPVGVGRPDMEWEALRLARLLPVPTPKPLAFDAEGDWFGGATIVMSTLPGSPRPTPGDLDGWAAQLATTLAAIHLARMPVSDELADRPTLWQRWTAEGLPRGVRTDAIVEAIERIGRRQWNQSFCHCDYHPGNVLFDGDSVSGVVDWSSSRRSPWLNDVGRLRMELALWPGGDAPERFTVAYEAAAGTSLDGLARWDVLAGAEAVVNGAHWVPAFEALEVPLTADVLSERANRFLDSALEAVAASER